MKLIQRLGMLVTALLIVSCSKKEPEIDYSWNEDSQTKLEKLETINATVDLSGPVADVLSSKPAVTGKPTVAGKSVTVSTIGATSAQGSGFIESEIGMISAADLANGISVTRDFTEGNFDAAITTDGLYGEGYGNNPLNNAGTVRYQIDLGSLQSIGRVNTYSGGGARNRDNVRGSQVFALYGSSVGGADFDETDASTWELIATVSLKIRHATYGGSSISGINANYRRLLWVAEAVGDKTGEGTVYKEFDVFAQ